jgi:hypothetical protein
MECVPSMRAGKDSLAAPLGKVGGMRRMGGEGGLSGLLCLRNARPQKDGKGSLVVLLLAERAQ